MANGMSHRGDKKKVPLINIPNGSGNAMAMAFAQTTVERSLEAIVKGHVVGHDLMRVTLDHHDEDDVIEKGNDPTKYIFYVIGAFNFGMMAQMVEDTTPFQKKLFGTSAYFF